MTCSLTAVPIIQFGIFNFWATVCKTVRPMLSDRCPLCLSVCLSVCLSCLSCPVYNVGVLWPNGWTDQDKTWQAGRHRPWPHCVRWKPNSHSPKGAQPPSIFGPYLLRPNGCMDQDSTWYGGRLSPGDFVLDGDPAPPFPERGGARTQPRRRCVRRGPSPTFKF